MQTVRTSYAQSRGEKQVPHEEPVEILTEDMIVSPPDEVDAFWKRLSLADRTRLKWAVITLWQKGDLPVDEAIFWLTIYRFIRPANIKDRDAAMRMYVLQQRAKAEGGKK